MTRFAEVVVYNTPSPNWPASGAPLGTTAQNGDAVLVVGSGIAYHWGPVNTGGGSSVADESVDSSRDTSAPSRLSAFASVGVAPSATGFSNHSGWKVVPPSVSSPVSVPIASTCGGSLPGRFMRSRGPHGNTATPAP